MKSQEAFTFLVLSDTHVRLPENADNQDYNNEKNLNNLMSSIERINNELDSASFVVVTGDLVGCLFSDNPDDYCIGNDNPPERFKSMMDQLTIPYYALLGNHDYQKGYDTDFHEGIMTENPEKIEAVWKKVLGINPYYSFMSNGYRFILLNSNRGSAKDSVCMNCRNESYCSGSFDEEQMDWLENELKTGTPSLLFFHHPPITDNNHQKMWSGAGELYQLRKEDRFYDIASRYKSSIKAIFCGHGHIWGQDTLNHTTRVFETGSTGDGNGKKDNIHIVRINPASDIPEVSIGNPNEKYIERKEITALVEEYEKQQKKERRLATNSV